MAIEDRPVRNSILILKSTVCTLAALLIFYMSGCSGNKSGRASDSYAVPENDSTYIFNGRDLTGWEITNFGPQGPVYVSEGSVILGMGDGCTGITYKKDFPRINYKVTLDAMRITGNDFFCGMTFPVDKDPCTLVVGGWGGGTVGLSSIDLIDASDNETTYIKRFENNRWYNICLIVKENEIGAWIDSVQYIDFKINGKQLSIRPEVELSKPFGITSWMTTAAIRNIRVEKLAD